MASVPAADTARLDGNSPGTVGLAWRASVRWRRRHWLVRVLILAIIGGDAVLGHVLIARAVRTAIVSIFTYAEPSLISACARARRAGIAHQLRTSLRLVADRDADGRIDQREAVLLRRYGLDKHHVDRSVVRADVRALIAAAHQAGVINRSYTYGRVLHDTFTLARADADAILSSDCARILETVRPYRMPDYTCVATWALGTRELGLSIAMRLTRLGAAGYLLPAAVIIGVAFGIGKRKRPWLSALGVCAGLCVACATAQWLLWRSAWSTLSGGPWQVIGTGTKASLTAAVCAQVVWATRSGVLHVIGLARGRTER